MTDKRQAESWKTLTDHTHALSIVVFDTKEWFQESDIAAAINDSVITVALWHRDIRRKEFG